ncbi:hypothetical protein Tco_0183581 [Tanacetum coccineum]
MTAKSRTVNNTSYIDATVAGKPVTISEASIRSDLLFDDADRIDSLTNQAIFDNIQLMGHEVIFDFRLELVPLSLLISGDVILSTVRSSTKHNLVSPSCDFVILSDRTSLPEGNTSGSAEDNMQLKELMDIVPKFWQKLKKKATEVGNICIRVGEEPEEQEEINTGREEINIGIEEVSTGSTKVE